jgi:poly(A) polymerase
VEQSEPHIHDVWEHTLAVAGWLEKILEALAPQAQPEAADDLFTGMLVMRLGRFRENLDKELGTRVAADRSMRSLLFLCTLFHDVAKPLAMKLDGDGRMRFWDHDQKGAELAATRGRHLALSNIEIQCLETVIRNHMRIIFHTKRLVSEGKPPSRRAVYRFFRDTGTVGVEVCLLSLADLRATYEETLPQENWAACLDVVRTLLENWYEKRFEIISPPGLVDGDELMRALKLDPGRKVGELLEVIREGQAMGEVSTVEQALELARKQMAEGSG